MRSSGVVEFFKLVRKLVSCVRDRVALVFGLMGIFYYILDGILIGFNFFIF